LGVSPPILSGPPSCRTSSAKSAANTQAAENGPPASLATSALPAAYAAYASVGPQPPPRILAVFSSLFVRAGARPLRHAAGGILVRSFWRAGMIDSRRRTLAALMAGVGLAAGCAGPSTGGGALWRENPAASAATDLARFNTLLADLAERLQPGLGQARGGRALKGCTPREESPEPRRSSGSGFVIDPSGLIITNAHVVDGAASILVRLNGGKRFQGKVIGRDNRVDLALLKIDGASGLTALPLGDSNRLRVGEFVLALGSPFGLEQSVSFGIVSRKGAPLTAATPGFDFIQTDAAINPGNSG